MEKVCVLVLGGSFGAACTFYVMYRRSNLLKEKILKLEQELNEIRQLLISQTPKLEHELTELKEKNSKLERELTKLKEKNSELENVLSEICESLSIPKPTASYEPIVESQESGSSNQNNKNERYPAMERYMKLDVSDQNLPNDSEIVILNSKIPNVHWDDVVGLEYAKNTLKEAAVFPIKFSHLFLGKCSPWKGILLFGPPGTGKSHLAKAVATEANKSKFFNVSSTDLISKYIGESEKQVKELFVNARKCAPSIIFIDEIDSLCGSPSDSELDCLRRVKAEFQINMEGIETYARDQIVVIGATNVPWTLDGAMLRRFEKRIYIKLPNEADRINLLKYHIGETENALCEVDYQLLAQQTDGFSGADIGVFVRDALMEPVRKVINASHLRKIWPGVNCSNDDYCWTPCMETDEEAVKISISDINPIKVSKAKVCMKDMLKALSRAKPSISKADLTKLEDFSKQFGCET